MRPILLFLALGLLSPVPGKEAGTVSGTVAFFEEDKFAGEVRNAGVFVKQGELEEKIEANEMGDFQAELSVGKWFLVRVTDEEGRSLSLDRNQAPYFEIASGQITRFDVMVRMKTGETVGQILDSWQDRATAREAIIDPGEEGLSELRSIAGSETESY